MIKKSVALIVAHPDDETLWAGGTILNNLSWKCFIACLCRKNDIERAQKFRRALKIFKAQGMMGYLDDGPDQLPLDDEIVENEILRLLPSMTFDLIITHHPNGEYTSHLRHEETGKAVKRLWDNGKISTRELWTFAYEDGNHKYLPISIKRAPIYRELTAPIWQIKYKMITEIYGFEKESWEARTTPKSEAFWQMTKVLNDPPRQLNHRKMKNTNSVFNQSTIKN